MSPPVVVLDACTLYPAALRDVVMRLALHQLIRARWTDAIHDEWIKAVLRDRSDLTRERLQRTRELMDLHAEGGLVTGYEWLLWTMSGRRRMYWDKVHLSTSRPLAGPGAVARFARGGGFPGSPRRR